MNYQEFRKLVRFGDFTAFAVMLPDGRFKYSSGIIDDSVFDLVSKETDFDVVPLNENLIVKNILVNNFLHEIAPACGVHDDCYFDIRYQLLRGDAKIAAWVEHRRVASYLCLVTRYMLLL